MTKHYTRLYHLIAGHYLFATLSFLALAPMLLFSANDLVGHYFQPHLLAITHTAALGWGTLIVFGTCYQFIPYVLKVKLYSYKLAWLSLATFCVGLIQFIYSSWMFQPGFHMQSGSLFLLLSIVLFTFNIFKTSAGSEKSNIYQDFILTSGIWLLVTAALGTLMVFNFRFVFLPKDHLVFLKLHAHAGLAGWFLLLIIGLSGRLLPSSLKSEKNDVKWLKWSYSLINIALLLFLIHSYLFGLSWFTLIPILVFLSGLGCWLVFIYECVSTRRKDTPDFSMMHAYLSILLLLLAVAILPFLIYYQLKADALAIRLTVIYGSLLLLGCVTSLLLGYTSKTLAYLRTEDDKSQHKKFTLKNSSSMYKNTLFRAQFVLFLLFISTFSFGLLLNFKPLIHSGIVCLAAVAIIYCSNIYIVLFKSKNI